MHEVCNKLYNVSYKVSVRNMKINKIKKYIKINGKKLLTFRDEKWLKGIKGFIEVIKRQKRRWQIKITDRRKVCFLVHNS